MIDPIEVKEEELKRSDRIKHYQDYQKHMDELDGKSKADSSGKLGSKKVKKIESKDNSAAINLFKNSINKT